MHNITAVRLRILGESIARRETFFWWWDVIIKLAKLANFAAVNRSIPPEFVVLEFGGPCGAKNVKKEKVW